jgi:hypothetical protein
MVDSSPPSNVCSDHIDSTVPQFIADLPPSLAIKALIFLATWSTVNRRAVLGYLLIALTRVRRS